jgi:hypothetical protein
VKIERPHIAVRSRRDIAPVEARDARVRAWAYVFECFARHGKKADAETNSGEEIKLANKERRAVL